MSTERSHQRASNLLGQGLGTPAYETIPLPHFSPSYLNTGAPQAPPAFVSNMIPQHKSPENMMVPSYSLSRANNLGLADNQCSTESQINLNVFVNPAQQPYQQNAGPMMGQHQLGGLGSYPQLAMNDFQFMSQIQMMKDQIYQKQQNLMNLGFLNGRYNFPASPALAPLPKELSVASLEKAKPATPATMEEQQDAGPGTAASSPKAAAVIDLKQPAEQIAASEANSDSEVESDSDTESQAAPLALSITATANQTTKKKRGRKSEPIEQYVKKSMMKIAAERALLATAKADGVDAKGRQRMRNKISALQDRMRKKDQLIFLETTVKRQEEKHECLLELVQEVMDKKQYAEFLNLKAQRWAERFQEPEEEEESEDEIDLLSEEPVQKKRRGKAAPPQSKPAPQAQATPAKRASKRIAKAKK